MAVTFAYSNDFLPAAPVVTVVVRRAKEVTLSAILDTGADCSIFPVNLLRRIGATYLETRRMISASGHTQTVNLYLVEVQIGDYTIPGVNAIGLISSNEAILGRDVLNHLIVTLDGIAGTTEIS
jgi:predicted aspartyl protease